MILYVMDVIAVVVGGTLDWDYEDKMKAQALEEMNRIEKLLGTPPEEYL